MKHVIVLLLLTLSARAQADCKPVKADGFTVSFNKENGIEIQSPDGVKTIVDLEDAPRPDCESLKLSETRDTPLAEIIYYPGESGTKVLIDDKNFALIDIKNKKLAIDPITLEEKRARPLHEDHDVYFKVAWKKKDGAMILEKTDEETKDVTQIWPITYPVSTISASPSPTPTPTPEPSVAPENRTPPAGIDNI